MKSFFALSMVNPDLYQILMSTNGKGISYLRESYELKNFFNVYKMSIFYKMEPLSYKAYFFPLNRISVFQLTVLTSHQIFILY